MKAFLRFGAGTTRGPTNQIQLELFDILGDVLHVASAIVDKPFWPYRLWILPTTPDNIEHLELRSLRIAANEQLAVDSVPARLFSLEAFGVSLQLDWANPGDAVSITLRNFSPEPVKLAMFLEGRDLDE